jgi:L-lysine exporter family protein LysE/ArgO
MVLAYVTGLLAGLSLIIAIGAQNAYVIRQGLTKKYVLLVVLVCAISDVILIVAGVAGLGAIINAQPVALEVIRWAGVAYLLWFAFKSIRAALGTNKLDATGTQSASLKTTVLTVLAMTWLNPHVYLDTVIFLGAVANQFTHDRWWFAAGASTGSILWFFSLGFGAVAASRFMSKPLFWKILDSLIAAVMVTLAITLATMSF